MISRLLGSLEPFEEFVCVTDKFRRPHSKYFYFSFKLFNAFLK